MAERYEAAAAFAAAIASPTVLAALHAGSKPLRLQEIWLTWGQSTSSFPWRLSRTTVAGTPTGGILGQAVDPGAPAALGQLAVAWSAAPTSGTTYFFRMAAGGSTAGVQQRKNAWRARGGGIVIPANGSIALTSPSASQACDIVFVWDE